MYVHSQIGLQFNAKSFQTILYTRFQGSSNALIMLMPAQSCTRVYESRVAYISNLRLQIDVIDHLCMLTMCAQLKSMSLNKSVIQNRVACHDYLYLISSITSTCTTFGIFPAINFCRFL